MHKSEPPRSSKTGRLADRRLGWSETKAATYGANWYRDYSPEVRVALKAAAKAAARGWAVPITSFAWDMTHRRPFCDEPVPVEVSKRGRQGGAPAALLLLAPCRKCAKCLLFRQLKWRERAQFELVETARRGNRSWWATLTFDPPHLAGILAEAKVKGCSVDRAAYSHVQKWLDRVRKAAKARFRYMAVYERGEASGRSHYHLLIHEVGVRPVLKRTLEDTWRSHVHARLVHLRGTGLATYVTKYATKSHEERIRASTGYGKSGGMTSRQGTGRKTGKS